MGAAREFRDLDFVAARDDFERLRASGANPGAIVKIWRVSPPTPEAAAAIEPTAYTPEWFAWIKVHRPEFASRYRLSSDDAQVEDESLDEQLLDDLVEDEPLDDLVDEVEP